MDFIALIDNVLQTGQSLHCLCKELLLVLFEGRTRKIFGVVEGKYPIARCCSSWRRMKKA